MPLYKMINGEMIEMSQEEEAAYLADVPTPEQKRAAMPALTMRQFRLGLLGAGLLSAVDAAIASMPEPDKSVATIEFEYAATVVRTHGFVVSLSAALGLTDEQVDTLWQSAIGL